MSNELTDADKAILESGDHEVKVQLAKFNTNIADGKDIHIGDQTSHKSVVQKGLENVQVGGDLTVNITQNAIQQTQVIQRPREEDLLLDDVKKEVKGRLKKSLIVENAKPINLRKELQPELVNCPWNLDIKIGSDTNTNPDAPKIIDIFNQDEIAGKLLIVGEPGSGKTTTLLELAEALVDIAGEQSSKPIPVILNLSSWQLRQPIRKWIVGVLSAKYDKSPKTIEQWLNEKKLLPLLDGLDELELSLHEPCIRGINAFLSEQNRPQFLVICSRKEEYINCNTRLILNGAACLLPLNNEQIKNYLQQIQNFPHSHTLLQDAILLNLLCIPLFLSLAIISCQDISLEKWQKIDSSEERLRYLWNTYIVKRLDYGNDASKSKREREWLTWIAQHLSQQGKYDFVITKFQPLTTFNGVQIQVYFLILFLILLSIIELSVYINTDLDINCFTHTFPQGIIVIVLIIYTVKFSNIITIKEKLFDSSEIKILAITAIFSGLISELFYQSNPLLFLMSSSAIQLNFLMVIFIPLLLYIIIALLLFFKAIFSPLNILSPSIISLEVILGVFISIYSLSNILFKAVFDSMYILITALFVFSAFVCASFGRLTWTGYFIYSLLPSFILVASIVYLSLVKYFFSDSEPLLYVGIVSGLIFGQIIKTALIRIVTPKRKYIQDIDISNKGFYSNKAIQKSFINAAVIGLISGLVSSIIRGYPQGIGIGLMFGLIYGGTSCIQYFVMHLIHYWNGYVPWNYTKFLNYATERTILQRVGGSYRFIHSLLQEHFVNESFNRS
jgi:hypothetical protein